MPLDQELHQPGIATSQMNVASRFLAPLAFAAVFASAAAGQQAAPQNRLPRDGFPVGPVPKILSFTSNPAAMKPGESATLEWVVVNADRITLDQGIGIVETRGSCVVSPSVTTTYTLSALGYTGTANDSKSVIVTVTGTAPASPARANEPAASKPVPRASDDRPDLSGVWIAPFHGVAPVGKVELKPGAEKYSVGPDYTFTIGERCLPRGVPDTMREPYPIQIVQAPSLVVILFEAEELFRVIPTDGRAHPPNLDHTWMGNSVGHWEGDTFVVDVTAFNDITAVGDYRHTTALHVVERFRRTAYDTLKYEATIDDPNVFAAPWTMAGTLTLHPEWQIQEYVCEENNHDYKQLFDRYKK